MSVVHRQNESQRNSHQTGRFARRLAGVLITGCSALLVLSGWIAAAERRESTTFNTEEKSSEDRTDTKDDPRLADGGSRQHGGGTMIPVVLVDDVVNIMGDEKNERVAVHVVNDQLSVSYMFVDDDGQQVIPWLSVSYPVDSVNYIVALMGDGNDTFVNWHHVQCTVYGGEGNDVLIGGFGADSLYGEGGGDTIFGGYGADYIEGGDRSDVLCGGPAISLLNNDLIDPSTSAFQFDTLTVEWAKQGYYRDLATDTIHGGPEDATQHADWFLLEVAPDDNDNPQEMDNAVDFIENFDWATFNNHYWME